MRAYFDFYGIRVRIDSGSEVADNVIQDLVADLEFFRVDDFSTDLDITITLGASRAEVRRNGIQLFSTPMCQVYGSARDRTCIYGSHDYLTFNEARKKRQARIEISDPKLLFEVTYTFLLSSVGEFLDRRGLHRIHAFGFQFDGPNGFVNGIVVAPRGVGKSSLAAISTKSDLFKIYSDEMPLIKKGILLPFPIRLALLPSLALKMGFDIQNARQFDRKLFSTKTLFPIPTDKVAQPGRLHLVLMATKTASTPNIRLARPWDRLTFLVQVVLGLGLPQMREFMIRMDSIPALIAIAFRRLRTALGALRISSVYHFRVGTDPNENLKVLLDFLDAEQGWTQNVQFQDVTLRKVSPAAQGPGEAETNKNQQPTVNP